MADPKYFLLIDGHALIYRAFFAFPKLTSPSGQLVNAVYGFSRILLTAIRNYEPTYSAVTFDLPQPTFRHTDYEAYKANRPEMPDELKPQVEIIKEVVSALNIPRFEIPGFEADDLIGTISCILDQPQLQAQFPKQLLTIIVTGDKDTFQLVDDNTHVWLPGRGKNQSDQEYDAQQVYERMGVYPNQITDLKALMGDASDNIPGVKGIGPKTAAKLIQEYKTLEDLYAALDSAQKNNLLLPKWLSANLVKKLINDRDNAFLSKQLATITCEVPLDFNLEACRVTDYDKTKIVQLFQQFDFNSLIDLLPADQFESIVQESLF